MNPTATTARPLPLLSAIAEFFVESLRVRGNSVAGVTPQADGELNAMELYRLTHGRETVDPSIGVLLASRFQ